MNPLTYWWLMMLSAYVYVLGIQSSGPLWEARPFLLLFINISLLPCVGIASVRFARGQA